MNREELARYIAESEPRYNIPGGEFNAIWRQESGRSVDPTLKGQYLPKWKSNATGPFQVVPAIHPSFPANGTVQDQADFALKLYASGGNTPDERMRRYYGTGKPLPGQPTTDQYVQQVSARMGGQQAAPEQPQPAAEQTMPNPVYYQPQYMTPASIDETPYAEPQPREQSGMEKWLSHPLTQIGMGMMLGSGTDWGRAIGMGMANAQNGIYEGQKAENDLYELNMKRAEARTRARREAMQEKADIAKYNRGEDETARIYELANELEARGQAQQAAYLRAGIKTGAGPTTFGTSPNYEKGPGGKTYVRRMASDGTMELVPIETQPLREFENMPEYKGKQAFASGQGSASGKAAGEAEAAQISNVKKAIDAQATIDRVRELLPVATASGAGALVDKGLSFVGQGTRGGDAAAALKIAHGKLVGMVDRFEGPQSDADRKLYEQMAGDVGNETMPVSARMAALAESERLLKKWEGGAPKQTYAPPGTPSTAGPSLAPKAVKWSDLK